MTDVLDQISDSKWDDFRADMERVVARNHFRPNVPESPEDTVQSAIHSFFKRRGAGEKRELLANTIEAVRLVLLYRAWAKNREHHQRANKVTNRAAKFGELDKSGDLEASVSDPNLKDPFESLFIKEVFEQIRKLPEQHQQVARLCMEGYDRKDIAQKLECSPAVVTGILAGLQVKLLGGSL